MFATASQTGLSAEFFPVNKAQSRVSACVIVYILKGGRLTFASWTGENQMKRENGFSGLFLIITVLLFIILQVSLVAREDQETGELKWYKGNTHTHTRNSDGDSFADEVSRWYREHGYNFLVITDHNHLTGVDVLNELYGIEGRFLVIRGDEVSDSCDGKPIHLNALNPDYNILAQGGGTVVESLQNNINAIRAASALVQINHPNFVWAITAADLKQVEGCQLFEIHNAHPAVNNLGGGGSPGVEEMWDEVLSSGKLMYGVGSDDAHTFRQPENRNAARPGQAWVMVQARELSAEAILQSMEKGDFYSSTGIELADYQVRDQDIRIEIKEVNNTKYRILFIGHKGKLLKEEVSSPATYKFRGDEKYVRARILDSNGNIAWTQPVMVNP